MLAFLSKRLQLGSYSPSASPYWRGCWASSETASKPAPDQPQPLAPYAKPAAGSTADPEDPSPTTTAAARTGLPLVT